MIERLNLIVTALVFGGYGLRALLAPDAAAAELGLGFTGADGSTALRAIYGGYLIGAGLLFAYAAADVRTIRFGLIAILFIVGPILATRLIGLALEGTYSWPHLQRVAMEVAGVTATAILLIRDRLGGPLDG